MRTVILKGMVWRKSRFVLTALAIVLGTAFLSATGVVSASIRRGVDELYRDHPGPADVEIRGPQPLSDDGPREPLDESIVARVRSVPGVADAAAMVQGFARVVDARGDEIGGLTTSTEGGSADGIGSVSPFELHAGRTPTGSDEVVIDASTAAAAGFDLGDRVTVELSGPAREFTLVGTVRLGSHDHIPGSTFALFDLETAQDVLDRHGEVDAVVAAGEPGVSDRELVTALSKALGDEVTIQTSSERADEKAAAARQDLALIDRAMVAFALIALVVSGFIIVNTFTIVVAQRTRELSLLRALGASERQVRRSVLAEAAVTGLIASTIGSAAGVGLAIALRKLVDAAGLELPGSGVVVGLSSFLVPIATGVLLTVLAASMPARRAGKRRPLAAAPLESTATRPGGRRTTIGAVLGALGAIGGLLGVPLVLLAAALLAPAIAPPVVRWLGWPGRRFGAVAGKLGYENTARSPSRTAATASALMIGLALVVGVTVVGESALRSFSGALSQAVRADFVVYSHVTDLSPEVADRLRQTEEVATVSQMRIGEFELSGEPGTQQLTAVDPETIGDTFDLGYSDGALSALADGGLLVSETKLQEHGWQVGDTVTVRFARTGERRLHIDGTYAADALEDQGFLVSLRDYEANFSAQRDVRVLVTAAPGTSLAEARSAIEAAMSEFPAAQVEDQAGYVAELKGALDIVLGITIVLLGLAVIIAVLGIVNTLALSIVERTSELGMLRAVGMSRRQLRAMITWESVTIALMGGTLGLAVGMLIGGTMAGSLGSVVTSVAIPWPRLGAILVFGLAAGVAAAVAPARRAARLDVLTAVNH